MLRQLKLSDKYHRLYLSCDEVSFTKHVNKTHDWSRMHTNTYVDKQLAFTAYRTALASISKVNGIDYYEIHQSAIKHEEFAQYLRNLRKVHGEVPLTLQLDNLGAHRDVDVQDLATELNIVLVWNKQDCPDYQPIESVFSEVKSHYRKIKLNKIANGRKFDIDGVIEEAFDRVPKEHVRRCIRHSR